jgi:transcriptional regulator with XRE-family HTH domain
VFKSNDTEELISDLNLNVYATAENCIDKLISDYEIDEKYTDEEKRIIAGMRYQMIDKDFSYSNDLLLAEGVDEQTVIDMKELGRRFKLIRQRLGMTQTEVGKQLNTTQLMICRVEKGENVLSPLLLSLLAFYSQSVSMDYLFSRNFDIDDENVFNKDFALNSIVKAKLNSLRDDVLGKLGKTEEEIRSQLDAAVELL